MEVVRNGQLLACSAGRAKLISRLDVGQERKELEEASGAQPELGMDGMAPA